MRVSHARSFLVCALLMCADTWGAPPPAHPPQLAFRIDEGLNLNSFVRDGPVAAHLLLRAGTEPRILVAFPAGNSGVGLWFEKTIAPVTWTLITPPMPLTTRDEKGRALHGIEFEVEVNAPELRPRGAVLSSVRVLRDFELQSKAPAEVMVPERVSSGRLSWSRDRLDGAAGYRLVIDAEGGAQVSANRITGSPLRLHIQAFSGEAPLTPLNAPLTRGAGDDPRARDALAFLSYEEKFLAGSWRFNTYFGRDTLISAMLLAPVLEPAAMESAIAAVLARLDPNGEVAHEEDIGEFAVLRNAREGRGRIATPIYDYGMIDDDFLLAPLAARWLSDDPGHARATAFLAVAAPGSQPHGKLLARNLAWLVERAAPFAADPRVENLVGIKPGRMTGNWRDSEQGLGRGRYPYDVNAALVPAALDAAARLMDSKLLDPYLDAGQRRTLMRAGAMARVWSSRAPSFFAVEIPAARARAAVNAYARESGVDGRRALDALGQRSLAFNALSLDEQGQPVPILHSDEGFRLLFTDPSPRDVAHCIDAIMRPFPAGLMTDIGLLVANPALASPGLRREFGRDAYHGTVVWSWQQALLAAGYERQLRRADLPPATRQRLERARRELWKVIAGSKALRTSELWSWTYADGRFRIEAFGGGAGHADESNAAQLWSTVFLGIRNDTAPGN